MDPYEQLRKEKDDFFKHDAYSPLTSSQKKEFEGLNYYPPDASLRLELTLEPFQKPDPIEMQTTTGDVREFVRLGQVHFEVDSTQAELTIYMNADGYFLPFVDSLAGEETYPAGRYLEPEAIGGGRFLIDFNLAYNPYCAYNDGWSCPITPAENRVKVPIAAGEKIYHPED
jgi:uncharacterized protein (DUF1684 family)